MEGLEFNQIDSIDTNFNQIKYNNLIRKIVKVHGPKIIF